MQQGSPISPEIFNMYIDTLYTALEAVPFRVSEFLANLFCDDVLLMAKDVDNLQRLLEIFSDWASSSGMKWSSHKCAALLEKSISTIKLRIAV